MFLFMSGKLQEHNVLCWPGHFSLKHTLLHSSENKWLLLTAYSKLAQANILSQRFISYLTQLIMLLEEGNKRTMTFQNFQCCRVLEMTVSLLW